MARFSHKMLLIAIGLLTALTIAGCSPPNGPDNGDPDTDDLESVCQGGNLHYQNMVLSIDDIIVFNSSSGMLSLSANDGTDALGLIETAGSNPVYDGEWIYFTQGVTSDYLMKIAIDGSNEVRIGRTPLKYLISHNGLLYAIESANGTAISLRTDGTGRKALVEFQATALALSQDRLFISGAGDTAGVVMIDLATGDQTQLLDRRVSSLNISGDWLYFADPANGFRLSAWSIASGEGKAISQTSVDKPFIVSNNHLFYIDPANQNRLFSLQLDGATSLISQTPNLVIDDAVGSFVICDDYVYYRRPSSSRIYRVSISGGNPLRIT